jgi:hypothetical protein
VEIHRSIDTAPRKESIIQVKDLIAEVMEAMFFCPEDISWFQLAAKEA